MTVVTPTLHFVEFALAAYLVLVLPALALRKSLREPIRPVPSRVRKYVKIVVKIAVLLLILAIVGYWSGWSHDALGLDFSLSWPGEFGFVITAVLIVVLVVGGQVSKRRFTAEKSAKHKALYEQNDLFPRTLTEFRWFVLVSLFVGVGWEVLYRGFLLFILSPLIGVVGAVVVAALAYGLAHGYKSRGQLIESIVSAFAFTMAFALTGSLWWLMLLHTFMGVYGGWNSYRLLSASGSGNAVCRT